MLPIRLYLLCNAVSFYTEKDFTPVNRISFCTDEKNTAWCFNVVLYVLSVVVVVVVCMNQFCRNECTLWFIYNIYNFFGRVLLQYDSVVFFIIIIIIVLFVWRVHVCLEALSTLLLHGSTESGLYLDKGKPRRNAHLNTFETVRPRPLTYTNIQHFNCERKYVFATADFHEPVQVVTSCSNFFSAPL